MDGKAERGTVEREKYMLLVEYGGNVQEVVWRMLYTSLIQVKLP